MATLRTVCSECDMCGGNDKTKVLVSEPHDSATEVLVIAHWRSGEGEPDANRAAKLTCGATPFDLTFSIRCVVVDDSGLAEQRCVVFTRQLLKAYRYFVIDEQSAHVLRLDFDDGKIKVVPFGVVLYVKSFDPSYGTYYAKAFSQMLEIANAKPMRKAILI